MQNTPNRLSIGVMKDATTMTCQCGSEIFEECLRVKRLSKLLTGEPDDRIFPLPAIMCKSCGKELELFRTPLVK